VCGYNQHMGGVDKKDQLLQLYLVERNRMNKCYTKLFRRLLNATVLNALTIYRHNVGRKVDHLKFRIDLIEGLFVKYSLERKIPGRREDDNTVRRLSERHFLREYHQQSKNQNRQEGTSSAVSMANKERHFITARTVMLHCVSTSVSNITTPKKHLR
jgi:hypothetical protein